MVKEAIKEGSILDSLRPRLDGPHGDPTRRLGPERSLPVPRAPRPWPLSLLVPGGPPPEGLHPKNPALEDDASDLTHGAGQVLCGNPTKGLRERQHRCQAGVPPEQLPPPRLEDLVARASTPGPGPAESCDLPATAAGPRTWREQRHLRHLNSGPEGAAAPRGSQGGLEEQQDGTGPGTSPSSPSLAPGTERDPAPTPGSPCHLTRTAAAGRPKTCSSGGVGSGPWAAQGLASVRGWPQWPL
ncbi:leucine rich repeat containing 56 [Phyllostomus discolor]|uniref:Leucine rich repeat containing 56 n=1 Tax=Phyllostomus discolor TaxID=89673 RepID=A0A834A830_9CHIR|nr:leucine rich repeat containing 56 [Phyllostomus discolor]